MKKYRHLIVVFYITIFSCTDDKKVELQLPPCAGVNSSYSQSIAPIIRSHCAISGCHNSDSTLIGNFNHYDDLKIRVDNGKFQYKVFDAKLMPPFSQPPLTAEEYNKLNCWFQAGAPQN